MDKTEKLTRAESNERDKARDLRLAALLFADGAIADCDGAELENTLQAAAKAWTNAYHNTSRCRKHLGEEQG